MALMLAWEGSRFVLTREQWRVLRTSLWLVSTAILSDALYRGGMRLGHFKFVLEFHRTALLQHIEGRVGNGVRWYVEQARNEKLSSLHLCDVPTE